MRVAVVAPRYGEGIVGGAEAAMRMYAERLVSQLGWRVEALTTCAADYMTWEDELPAGESMVNGVRVRRFPSVHGRTAEFDVVSRRVLPAPQRAALADSERWIELQGPRSPELIEAIASCDADVVAFSPYLYYPSVRGIETVARRSIFQPAAHDEPPIYLPVFRDTFMAAAGFVFYGDWERGFVQDLFGVGGTPQVTLGIGIDDPGPVAAIDRPDIDGGPYVCCLGRVDGGKGTSALAEMFAAYKDAHPGPLKLVMIGPVVTKPREHPDIVMTGQVDEGEKWALIDGSIGLVSPSPFESFAIVLLEAWTRGKPVIVNEHCAATREQVRRSGGGLTYADMAGFVAAVERLSADDELREELARRGRSYLDANYRWERLVDQWGRFAERVAERGAARAPSARPPRVPSGAS